MKHLVKKYINAEIGINLDKPSCLQQVTITEVNDTYFSVMSNSDQCLHHLPYSSVLEIVENPDGVKTGAFWQRKTYYALVIKVRHLIE